MDKRTQEKINKLKAKIQELETENTALRFYLGSISDAVAKAISEFGRRYNHSG